MSQKDAQQFEEDYKAKWPVSSAAQTSSILFEKQVMPGGLEYTDGGVQIAFNMWLAGKQRTLKAYGINPDLKLPPPLPFINSQEEPDQAWEFWKQFVFNKDGSVNIEAVKNELSDFSMVLRFYSAVLCEVTGGMISKPNIHPTAVISVFIEYLTLRCNEAVCEALSDAVDYVRARSGSKEVPIEAANEIIKELLAVKKAFDE